MNRQASKPARDSRDQRPGLRREILWPVPVLTLPKNVSFLDGLVAAFVFFVASGACALGVLALLNALLG